MSNTTEMPKLLTEQETAEALSIKPQTLALWRTTKRYDLAYVKIGRAVRYRAADVQAWMASRTVNPSA